MGRIFGIVRDGRAYLALIHMLFAPMLSLFFFLWLIGMIPIFNLALIWADERALLGSADRAPASNAGLLVISALLAVAAFVAQPLMSAAMLWFVRLLTGAKIKVVETLRITSGAFWMMALYMLLTLLTGFVSFFIAVIGLSLSLGVTFGCLRALITNDASNINFDGLPGLTHLLHTAPGLIVFAILGVLLFFFVLHVARGIGWLHGRIAELLLVRL